MENTINTAVAGKGSLYGYGRVCTGINILSWDKRLYAGTKDFTGVSSSLYEYRFFSTGIICFLRGKSDDDVNNP
jgi:hypothetical protein